MKRREGQSAKREVVCVTYLSHASLGTPASLQLNSSEQLSIPEDGIDILKLLKAL